MFLWLAVIFSSTCNAFALTPENTTDSTTFENVAYCDEDWIQYEQHCFKYENSQLMEWMNASEYCSSMGGHLASVHSKEQNDILQKYLLRNKVSNIWIGLHKMDLDGEFTWDDGSHFGYSNWARFEPFGDHWRKGDCVEIVFSHYNDSAGTWVVLPCTSRRTFLCQRLIPGITTTSVQNVANQTVQTVDAGVPIASIEKGPGIPITTVQTVANQTLQTVEPTTTNDSKEYIVSSIPGITITSIQTVSNQTLQIVKPTTAIESKEETISSTTSIHTTESKGIYASSVPTAVIPSVDAVVSSVPTTIIPSKKEIVNPVPTPEIQIENEDNSPAVTTRISPNGTIDTASTKIASKKDNVSFVLTTEITDKRDNNHPVLKTETTNEKNNVHPVLSTETSEKNKHQSVVPTTEKPSESKTGHSVVSTEKNSERNNNHPVLTTEKAIERNNVQPVGVTEKISEKDKGQLGAMFITTLVVMLALVIGFILMAVLGGKKYCVRPCFDYKHLKSETVLLMSAESTFERSVPVDTQDQDKDDAPIKFSQL